MSDTQTRYSANSQEVAAKVVDGEAILINLSNGLYYNIPGSGGHCWAMLEQGHGAESVAESLSGHYGIPMVQALADVNTLIEKLVDEKILVSANGDSGMPAAPQVPELEAGEYVAPVLHKHDDMADMFALDPPLPGVVNATPETLER